jgi:hypothetical protein
LYTSTAYCLLLTTVPLFSDGLTHSWTNCRKELGDDSRDQTCRSFTTEPETKRHVRTRNKRTVASGTVTRNCLDLSRTSIEHEWQENCFHVRVMVSDNDHSQGYLRETYLKCPCPRSGHSMPKGRAQQVSTWIASIPVIKKS